MWLLEVLKGRITAETFEKVVLRSDFRRGMEDDNVRGRFGVKMR